jgi:hypothetical protein
MLFLRLLLRRRWMWWRLLRVGIRVAMMRCRDDEDAETLRRTYCYILVDRCVWKTTRISARV